MTAKINKDSFEYNYKRLEEIMEKLESNIEEYSLDDIMKYYQEGLKLIKICRKKLEDAELKIEKINADENG
ncbi:MAG: exodeoxyribonuclease VII small subunit [Ignavibacteria bacterium]|nr:exodeoxyribonuclease VII small subunit [Ignavibacteria bacterium]